MAAIPTMTSTVGPRPVQQHHSRENKALIIKGVAPELARDLMIKRYQMSRMAQSSAVGEPPLSDSDLGELEELLPLSDGLVTVEAARRPQRALHQVHVHPTSPIASEKQGGWLQGWHLKPAVSDSGRPEFVQWLRRSQEMTLAALPLMMSDSRARPPDCFESRCELVEYFLRELGAVVRHTVNEALARGPNVVVRDLRLQPEEVARLHRCRKRAKTTDGHFEAPATADADTADPNALYLDLSQAVSTTERWESSFHKGSLWALSATGIFDKKSGLVAAEWRGLNPRYHNMKVALVGTEDKIEGLLDRPLTAAYVVNFSAVAAMIEGLVAFACHSALPRPISASWDPSPLLAVQDSQLCVKRATPPQLTNKGPLTSEGLKAMVEAIRILLSLSREQTSILWEVGAMWCQGASTPTNVLVSGVFGSGKSTVLAGVVLLLGEEGKEKWTQTKSWNLDKSGTNKAVDCVVHKLIELPEPPSLTRLGKLTEISPDLLPLAAGTQSSHEAACQEFQRAFSCCPSRVQAILRSEQLPLSKSVWKCRRVIATTAHSALICETLETLKGRFPVLIIDEAAQIIEPLTLAVMQRLYCTLTVQMGDPRQLPAIAPGSCALGVSQLERLSRSPASFSRKACVLAQHRCHPDLARVCSRLFYEGKVVDAASTASREPVLQEWGPLAWIQSAGACQEQGHSFYNDQECAIVMDVVHALKQRNAKCSVGVIALYRAQADRLAAQINRSDVDASTVDAFQGSERDVIVMSCVRNHVPSSQREAFTECPRRVNVALSRTRRQFILVASPQFMQESILWRAVVASAHVVDFSERI
ncbi:MAG: hypothetical protein KVP17_002176 [Porospora cf. gigantea B]|uniref:uncharacterized protein n=1 Tax=Porospora cf. gigantea B TaxID=2853592 RepID=UPI003571C43E|nr:MAG: hypothetical protein KVP17_002176 [Porospora cf. gigantea B]